jgi:hypothetical protein
LFELGFESPLFAQGNILLVIEIKDPWVVFFNILMLSLHLPLLFPPPLPPPKPNQPKKKSTNEEDQKVVLECGK